MTAANRRNPFIPSLSELTRAFRRNAAQIVVVTAAQDIRIPGQVQALAAEVWESEAAFAVL